MAYFDPERGEVVLRIVYDGLAMAGKTANLRALHGAATHRARGGLIVPAENRTGRTLEAARERVRRLLRSAGPEALPRPTETAEEPEAWSDVFLKGMLMAVGERDNEQIARHVSDAFASLATSTPPRAPPASAWAAARKKYCVKPTRCPYFDEVEHRTSPAAGAKGLALAADEGRWPDT